MTVYEFPDDYGSNPAIFASKEYGSAGKEIACCTIYNKYIIIGTTTVDIATKLSGRGRGLDVEEDVDVFTREEFRELFGFEPEQDEEVHFLEN